MPEPIDPKSIDWDRERGDGSESKGLRPGTVAAVFGWSLALSLVLWIVQLTRLENGGRLKPWLVFGGAGCWAVASMAMLWLVICSAVRAARHTRRGQQSRPVSASPQKGGLGGLGPPSYGSAAHGFNSWFRVPRGGGTAPDCSSGAHIRALHR